MWDPQAEVLAAHFDVVRYDARGHGGSGPALVLVHALACDLTMWDPQAEALSEHFDVVRYDVRGHGDSPADVPFTFDDLADDLAALLDELGMDRAHVCGVSMGGVIARLFALRHPARLGRLVLCSTMTTLPAGAAASWEARARTVRKGGVQAIVDWSLAQWFPSSLMSTGAVEHVRAMMARTSTEGYLQVCSAVPKLDFFARQGTIRAPTLVLAGAADPKLAGVAPETLARAIPCAELQLFPGAGHFPNLDAPAAFNEALIRFSAKD